MALFALGVLGAIACADALETDFNTFALAELVSLATALAGVWLYNKKADAEAPAHTMKNSQRENS